MRYHEDSNGRFLCVAEGDESRNELDGGQRQTECSETGTGVTEHDGAGKHLLNALEQLQQDYMQRLNEWESAFVELQKMFSLTQRDNAMLNERVMKLSQQVQHLSERTERLEPVIQREQEIRDERLMQEREHELSLNGSGSWMALRWDGD